MFESPQVLIVEDEPVVLRAAGMALEAHGIGFRAAHDIAEATEHLAAESFSVIVTDLKLPKASGFEILDLVRETIPRPQVIIITGYATIENALKSFQLGSFDFVPKPFDADELVSVVDRALRYVAHPTTAKEEDTGNRFLGRHSWARLDADGAATLGAAETVTSVARPIESIDCNAIGQYTGQGKSFCTIAARGGFIHRVRAPLSGQVIARNPKLRDDPDLVYRQPLSEGWLARIIPNNLEKELLNLTRPRPSGGG